MRAGRVIAGRDDSVRDIVEYLLPKYCRRVFVTSRDNHVDSAMCVILLLFSEGLVRLADLLDEPKLACREPKRAIAAIEP